MTNEQLAEIKQKLDELYLLSKNSGFSELACVLAGTRAAMDHTDNTELRKLAEAVVVIARQYILRWSGGRALA